MSRHWTNHWSTVVEPAWAAALWNARYRPRLGQAVGSGQEARQVI